ncbi:hypothetical protein N7490_009501 [Penicillium lividum]|nr:hypothetical protein N7490_009501 [Penicillium lividum]
MARMLSGTTKKKWIVTSRDIDGRRTVVSSKGVSDGEIEDDIVYGCDISIKASAYLNNRAKFKPDIDLSGKRVASIGNGSSIIQVTGAARKVANNLGESVISIPDLVTANVGSRLIGQGVSNMTYDEEQQHGQKMQQSILLSAKKSKSN